MELFSFIHNIVTTSAIMLVCGFVWYEQFFRAWKARRGRPRLQELEAENRRLKAEIKSFEGTVNKYGVICP
jgi:hypothetical protein